MAAPPLKPDSPQGCSTSYKVYAGFSVSAAYPFPESVMYDAYVTGDSAYSGLGRVRVLVFLMSGSVARLKKTVKAPMYILGM